MAIPFVWFGLTYLSITAYIAMTLLIFLAGIYICGKTATYTGTEDHSAIVWDEIAGYFVAMVAVAPSWTHLFIAFVLFRLFDITKPWPISWCDKHIKGGVGIMLDDILAGLLTWICMQVLVINAIF
jgi:phosphatidylglycerophosphatase A